MDRTEIICSIALNKVFGFKPKIASALIDAFGTASAVIAAGSDRLEEILGPFKGYDLHNLEALITDAERQLSRTEAVGGTYIPMTDPAFPSLLKECEDCPSGIFLRSSSSPEELFSNERQFIAFVGTREMTQYGEHWCRQMIAALAESDCKPTIVSGLAYGVDITAHKAALDYGLPTIAVMATGIESIYPYRHEAIAQRMTQSLGSALVTDYPPGTEPLKINFLRRNRIIAGMSAATILVESKEKGGGMLTANLAFSYGREVYALPGRADDRYSAGCNRLIRSKIAESIKDAEGLVSALGYKSKAATDKDNTSGTIVSRYSHLYGPEELGQLCRIAETIKKERGVSVDELSQRCCLPYGKTSSFVSLLESDCLITCDLLGRCSMK